MNLLHGDCLDLLPTVADGSVDMVFADLPYAHMSGGKVRRCTANAWDSPIDLEPLWAELLRVGKRNAAFVFTATQPFATALICSQPKLFRYDLVWQKMMATGFLNAKKQPLRCHESVLVFYRAQPVYNPQKTTGHAPYKLNVPSALAETYGGKQYRRVAENGGDRYPLSVMQARIVRSDDTRVHPTQKPVALLEWLIRTYSNPGDTVLDPTAGSGTTGVACINTGRQFIGIEKDATYYATALRRIAEAQPPLPGAA